MTHHVGVVPLPILANGNSGRFLLLHVEFVSPAHLKPCMRVRSSHLRFISVPAMAYGFHPTGFSGFLGCSQPSFTVPSIEEDAKHWRMMSPSLLPTPKSPWYWVSPTQSRPRHPWRDWVPVMNGAFITGTDISHNSNSVTRSSYQTRAPTSEMCRQTWRGNLLVLPGTGTLYNFWPGPRSLQLTLMLRAEQNAQTGKSLEPVSLGQDRLLV